MPTAAADTIPALLRERVLTQPHAPFLLLGGEPVSFLELDAASDRVATALLDMGIGRGDRVAVAAPNGLEWVTLFFATAKLGAVLVTLNVVYRERELVYMLNQSGARVVVSARTHAECDFVALYAALRDRLPRIERFVYLGNEGEGAATGDSTWSKLPMCGADPARLVAAATAVQPTDPAVILYTSGTTGLPKGAILTQASLLAAARAQATHLAHAPDDVMIGSQPLNHVGGLVCTVLAQLVGGGAVAFFGAYTPKAALETLRRDRVTVMVGVPTMYARLLALPELADFDSSRVRLCIVGGSNLEPALADRVHRAFPHAAFVNLYGMSETSGAAIISPPTDSLETICQTVGVLIGDGEAEIVDAEGKPLPEGEAGELRLRGSGIAAGYWELPDAEAGVFLPGGWLATGDMASRRADGRFTLRGRKKEMYIRSGYNVYPAEVENVVATHPSVEAVAIVGAPDEVLGEIGVAFVVCKPGAALEIGELRQFASAQVARYKVPDRLVLLEAMPLTPVGKIKKADLVERARALPAPLPGSSSGAGAA